MRKYQYELFDLSLRQALLGTGHHSGERGRHRHCLKESVHPGRKGRSSISAQCHQYLDVVWTNVSQKRKCVRITCDLVQMQVLNK